MNILSAFGNVIASWINRGSVSTAPAAPLPALPNGALIAADSVVVDTLARTIWGEARGDNYDGMHAVANVICTRAAHPRWWGSTIVGVCDDPGQFDCWNADDPNRAQLLSVTTANAAFVMAMNIAREAVAGNLPDITRGSDSYYAPAGVTAPPKWATPDKFRAAIGRQRFYRVELPPLPA